MWAGIHATQAPLLLQRSMGAQCGGKYAYKTNWHLCHFKMQTDDGDEEEAIGSKKYAKFLWMHCPAIPT